MRSTVLADQSGSSEVVLQTCKGTALEQIFGEVFASAEASSLKEKFEQPLTQVLEPRFPFTRREGADPTRSS